MDPFVKCRCCLLGAASAFSLYTRHKNSSISFAEMVLDSCSLEMRINDGKPSHICLECSRKLIAAYEFREMCLYTDKILTVEREQQSSSVDQNVKEEPLDFLHVEIREEHGTDDEPPPSEQLGKSRKHVKLEPEDVGSEHGTESSVQICVPNNRDCDTGHYEDEESNSDDTIPSKADRRQCKLCHLPFPTRTKYVKHMKTAHPDIVSNYDCECGAVFARKLSLRRHKMEAHGERNFSCTYCSKKFSIELRLSLHVSKAHTSSRPHKCEVCEETFGTSGRLKEHRLIHSKMKSDEATETKSDSKDSFITIFEEPLFKGLKQVNIETSLEQKNTAGKRIEEELPNEGFIEPNQESVESAGSVRRRDGETVCDLCEQQCSTRVRLKEHIDWVHKGVKYYCKLCKKYYTSESRHNKSAHSSGKHCVRCDIFFDTKTKYESHVKASHVKEIRHRCSLCYRYFKSKFALENHKIKNHKDGMHKYVCQFCAKIFQYKSSLQSHLIHSHTTEKPHPCDLCKLTFKTATELKRHRARHTAERDIPCGVCDALFKTRTDLLVHTRNVHNEGVKRYPCATCGKLFARSDHRNKHQRNVHRMEDSAPGYLSEHQLLSQTMQQQ